MRGAVLLTVDVDTRSRAHQLAFVDLDVETAGGWASAARDANGHRIHGASDVGGGEVVGNRDATHVVVATASLPRLRVFA